MCPIESDLNYGQHNNEENQSMLDKIKSLNAISLHVRRGDYVNLTHIHGLCDLNYYKRTIDYIASRVQNPHFFVFSDDIPWVRENLKIEYPFDVVDINDGKTAFCDIWLMKHCQHNIIANSSFSYWGAWLNENPDKFVVAPQIWFVENNDSFKDIVPKGWIRL